MSFKEQGPKTKKYLSIYFKSNAGYDICIRYFFATCRIYQDRRILLKYSDPGWGIFSHVIHVHLD